MSSPHADDAFTIKFDDAVGSMHQRSYRGNKPSGGLWSDIRSQMQPNGVDATPISTATPPRRRGVTPVASTSTPRHGSRLKTNLRVSERGSSTWVALGLVVLLVVSGLYLNQLPKTDTRENQVAWAPGTTVPNPADEIVTASPWASPQAIDFGPGRACAVEPLTADEVFFTVLNPENGYRRLGDGSESSRKYEENRSAWPQPLDQDRMMLATAAEQNTVEGAIQTAETFWNCLMTGSAFQVWALTSPVLVQVEVLMNLPVVRSEADIRAYIDQWGPRRYSSAPSLVWPRLTNADGELVGVTYMGGVLVGLDNTEERKISTAVVMLIDPESIGSRHVELSLSVHVDGSWTVIGYEIPGTPG